MLTKKTDTQLLFIHEFLTFAKAGVSLVDSLDFLRKQSSLPRAMRVETEALYQYVLQGNTLAKSLREKISFLEKWQIDLIESAELSGTLRDGFSFIKSILETKKEHTKKIIFACIHPAFYTLVFIVFYPLRELIGFLLHRDFAYLSMYLWAEVKLWVIIGSVVFFFKFLPVIFKGMALGPLIDGLSLRIPFFGKAMRNMYLYQFFYVFGACYVSGCSVIQSWDLSSQMIKNQALAVRMEKGKSVLKAQGDLDTAFFVTKLFPEKIVNLIKVGLKSGTMKDQTHQCMRIYQERFEMNSKAIEVVLPKLFYFVIAFLLIGIIFKLVGAYTNVVFNLVPLDAAF